MLTPEVGASGVSQSTHNVSIKLLSVSGDDTKKIDFIFDVLNNKTTKIVFRKAGKRDLRRRTPFNTTPYLKSQCINALILNLGLFIPTLPILIRPSLRLHNPDSYRGARFNLNNTRRFRKPRYAAWVV